MTVRTMAVVSFRPPDENARRPGAELLERIRFGLGAFGHDVGPAEDDVFCWVAEVAIDEQRCLVRVGWTGDEWLITIDPPAIGPFPRLRGLLGSDDPREAAAQATRKLAVDLHAVLGGIGVVRWHDPDEHATGAPGHEGPIDQAE